MTHRRHRIACSSEGFLRVIAKSMYIERLPKKVEVAEEVAPQQESGSDSKMQSKRKKVLDK